MTLKERIDRLSSLVDGMSVLYVEDEALIRENIKLFLDTIFKDVWTASNGIEGFNLYKERKFDIVITDLLMPEMNGIEIVQKIKELSPDQPVIVISACLESAYLLELINLGIIQFLLKPIQTEQMVETLDEIVMDIYNKRKTNELNSRLKQELVHQSRLLQQYKEVVDLSAIVTQTDIYGNITYVNDAFCDTTGYSYDEVISKSHNVVRHPDVSPEFYKNLWDTILSKQTWRGVIKNLSRDGNQYITNATIRPILDEYDNIIDFISISYNTTELYTINEEIWQTQQEMLLTLGEVGETRSQETGNHVRRVAKFAKLLGELYGLEEDELRLLYSAAPMHDIGKIGIADSILLKRGKLDVDEYESIKKHTKIGYEILKRCNRPLLQAAAIIAHEHHEKWDGTGYPNAVQGESIHIYGRIIALADVFDALISERVYKRAWDLETTVAYLLDQRGKHFDPVLVDIFVEHIDKFHEIFLEYKD